MLINRITAKYAVYIEFDDQTVPFSHQLSRRPDVFSQNLVPFCNAAR